MFADQKYVHESTLRVAQQVAEYIHRLGVALTSAVSARLPQLADNSNVSLRGSWKTESDLVGLNLLKVILQELLQTTKQRVTTHITIGKNKKSGFGHLISDRARSWFVRPLEDPCQSSSLLLKHKKHSHVNIKMITVPTAEQRRL